MRKVRRQSIKIIFVFLIVITGVWYYFGFNPEVDRNSKIEIIERSINSNLNKAECLIPNLQIDNPEIMKFYHPVSKIDCGNILDDWVRCEKSICFVKPEVIAKYGEITCSYTDIIRKNDYKSRYGKSIKTKEPYVLQATDFVKVVCTSEHGISWFGMAYGIRDGVENTLIHNYVAPPLNNLNPFQILDSITPHEMPSYFNVLMFGFDSLSRNAFIRKLPKTYEYLTKTLNAIVLKGYNIVGDGTPQALVPILTGHNELELPETRKRMSNAVPVDEAYNMIWKEYEKNGYITSFNEDLPAVGTFTYRMTGFQVQPVHHYLRTYYVEAPNLLSSSKVNCISHEPDHVTMLEYTMNFMTKYKDAPRFVFSFHGGLSHDSINLIEAADDDVVAWLESLKAKQILDNTILIFMSDHGNRFATVRSTLQGKQEERLPFFSFSLPEHFKRRFPTEYANIVENSERLTTPYDIHATLEHILELQAAKTTTTPSDFSSYDENMTNEANIPNKSAAKEIKISDLAKNRAISLFNKVPKNRSCADAYIEMHWCSCLNWQPLNLTAETGPILKAAGSIIKRINSATELFREYCEVVELKHINWAMRLRPHKELLSFKHNSDVDGFLADLTDNTNPEIELYQLQILTTPGDSLFEASVRYNLSELTMETKLSEISRINKYGTQANCIYDRDPELRKFCYCKA